jgi:SNF2 family DNA or RNA helicase
VHRNCVDNEIPAHLPEWTEYRAAYWKAPSTASKAHQQAWDAAANHGPGLAILAVNVEALSHKGAFEEIRAWARRRKVLCVVDESNDIDNTKAKRTKNVIKIGEQALYRRIATGTPVGERPLDLYAQFAFLGPGMLGFQDFESFKRTYAKLEVVHGVEGWRWGVDPETGRLAKIKAPVERVVGFRDLNDLSERIAPHSFRVLKRDCLDLPDKVYAKWPVELTPEQATHYRELKNQLWTEVKGKLIAAPRAITLLLRFQQLTGGYPEAVPLDNNPRLHALAEYARALPGFFIVWAHFRAELEGIAQTLRDALRGWEIVLYHGGIPQEQRARAVKAFQDGTARVFVGNPAAAGRGLTLTNADQVAYYSNSFSLTERLQSEDRAHRIGQKNNVTYTDFYAPGTIDEKVLDALRNKKALADVVTGDEIMQWI